MAAEKKSIDKNRARGNGVYGLLSLALGLVSASEQGANRSLSGT